MPFLDKYVHAKPVFELAGRQVKPYHITCDPDGVLAPAIVDAGYAMAEQILPPPDHEMPPASWLILHQGRAPMYLCVYDWVWGNAVEVFGAAAGEPFFGCPDDDPAHFVPVKRILAGCVWELTLLEHERAAWTAHMLVPDEPDLAGYLAETVPDGPVGIERHAVGPALTRRAVGYRGRP